MSFEEVPTDVLFIPGIGGHPRFHQPLIDALTTRVRVHTAPHGDFFTDAFLDIDRCVGHWATLARRLDVPGRLHVVAVSFGGQLVPGLVAQLGGAVASATLLSPLLLGPALRRLLAPIRLVPAALAAPPLGRLLMHFSNRQTSDRPALDALRRELYDEPTRVAARWRRRLIIASGHALARELGTLASQVPITLIFGRSELIYRLSRPAARRLVKDRPRTELALVEGGHGIGTAAPTPRLLDAILRAAAAAAAPMAGHRVAHIAHVPVLAFAQQTGGLNGHEVDPRPLRTPGDGELDRGRPGGVLHR